MSIGTYRDKYNLATTLYVVLQKFTYSGDILIEVRWRGLCGKVGLCRKWCRWLHDFELWQVSFYSKPLGSHLTWETWLCRERNYLLLFRIVRLGGNNSILSRWCQLLLLIQTPRSHNNSVDAVLGRHCVENPGKRLWLREGWGVEMGHCKAQYHRTRCNPS